MIEPTASLTHKQLADALDGLHAYDDGSVQSGIHDEGLRHRCIAQLHAMAARPADGYQLDEANLFLSRFVAERCVSEDALKEGYSIEDAKGFIDWLSFRMDFDL